MQQPRSNQTSRRQRERSKNSHLVAFLPQTILLSIRPRIGLKAVRTTTSTTRLQTYLSRESKDSGMKVKIGGCRKSEETRNLNRLWKIGERLSSGSRRRLTGRPRIGARQPSSRKLEALLEEIGHLSISILSAILWLKTPPQVKAMRISRTLFLLKIWTESLQWSPKKQIPSQP